MLQRPSQLSKAFKDYKNGQMGALETLLKAERERLFDYIMRMTGQLAKSGDVTEEVLAALEQTADEAETPEELYVMMFKTARNFASDAWNADTSKLENAAYQSQPQKEGQVSLALEYLVRSLSPELREIIILRDRYGFLVDEVAEIISMPTTDVEIKYEQAISLIEANLTLSNTNVSQQLMKMQPFVQLNFDGPETQNLSLIMNDFRKTSRIDKPVGRWVIAVLVTILAGTLWYYSDELISLVGSAR